PFFGFASGRRTLGSAMCSLWFGSASAAWISSRVNWPVRIGSSPLMPCAASPSAIALTSSGCRRQSSAIWSNDNEVFSTSHTAVAFGIKGAIAIAKSPLCFARPLGEATRVINDDWKAFLNIGGAAVPRNRPFLVLDLGISARLLFLIASLRRNQALRRIGDSFVSNRAVGGDGQ